MSKTADATPILIPVAAQERIIELARLADKAIALRDGAVEQTQLALGAPGDYRILPDASAFVPPMGDNGGAPGAADAMPGPEADPG